MNLCTRRSVRLSYLSYVESHFQMHIIWFWTFNDFEVTTVEPTCCNKIQPYNSPKRLLLIVDLVKM